MKFEPASEGFLDFFKKKSKQPSKVEKSNILNKMTPGKSINYEEISQKLADMYPDDAKKEFDNRRKYLKTILNAITEVSKKYKNIPGIEFDSAINMIKCFIVEKASYRLLFFNFLYSFFTFFKSFATYTSFIRYFNNYFFNT